MNIPSSEQLTVAHLGAPGYRRSSLGDTMSQWFHSYLRYLKIRGRSESHQDRVARSFKRFHQWVGTKPYETFSIDVIEEYALWLLESAIPHFGTSRQGNAGELAVATRRAYLVDMRAFMRWCGGREYLPERAYKWVPIPTRSKKEPKRALNADIAAILDAASDNLRDYTVCCLLIDFGPRASELATLRVEHCDLERRVLKVHGKTGDRHAMISSHAADSLREWLEVRNTSVGYVFPGRIDGHLTTIGVYQILKRLKIKAGVRGRVNPHAWRHAYITNSLVKGGNLGMTRMQAGHSNITTTQEYMEDFLGDEMREYQQRVTSLPDLAPAQTPKATPEQVMLPKPQSADELADAIRKTPNWQALGRMYGVSGVAVKKWAVKWGLVAVYETAHRL